MAASAAGSYGTKSRHGPGHDYLIILILLLIDAIPARGRFGNAPLGIVGTILLIVIILMLIGRI